MTQAMAETSDTPLPPYLKVPDPRQKTYGRLRHEGGYWVIEEAPPFVRTMAKRVFPGASTRGGRDGPIQFRATRRLVGELAWFMQRYPLSIEDRAIFDDHLAHAREHAVARETNRDLTPANPPATFRGELHDFQAAGVSFLVANERTILADEMGLGKTVQALAAIAHAQATPALVVCPASVQRQWMRMAELFLAFEHPESLIGDASLQAHMIRGLRPYKLPSVPLYVIHYGLLRGWKSAFPACGFRAVIFDEVQELRHWGTEKYSAASAVAEDARYVWGLSGTPIHNYGDEIWSVTNVIDFNCLGDRETFTREWCTGYGNREVEDPEALRDHLKTEGLMLRRRKRDVQGELPAKRRVVTAIDKEESVYRKMIANAEQIAQRYDQLKGWQQRGQAIAEMDRESRRATGVAKAPHAARFVATLIDAGERPLVFAWHHDVHERLEEDLRERDPVKITGKQNHGERHEALKQFAAGDAGACLLSLRTAAGLDGLQQAATCVVFAELDWSPAIHAQCEDRAHRVDTKVEGSLLCYYLVTDSGHDEVMQDALGLKIGQFVGLMGDPAHTSEDEAMAQSAASKHMETIVEKLRGGTATTARAR